VSLLAGQKPYAHELRTGEMVGSYAVTAGVTVITTEFTVATYVWTPPWIGTFRVEASIPFDVSAQPTECKFLLRQDGVALKYKVLPGAAGLFLSYLDVAAPINVTDLDSIEFTANAQRTSGAGTLNVRLDEIRIDVYAAGPTGLKA
jgi:hypothetical protein